MRSMRRAFALGMSALVVTSCASSGRAGVRVDSIQANIVFDVKQPEPGQVAAPGTPTYSGVSSSGGNTALPPLRVPGAGGIDFEVPADTVAGSCPQAPIGAAPPSAATDNPPKPPEPGLYRYKISGTQTISVNGSEISSPLNGFEPRIIRNIKQTSETFWTYEVVTPGATGGTDVTTWSVNTNPVQASRNAIVRKEITVGEPARGVAVAQIDSFDGNGNNFASFRPSPAILELPLPVVAGSDWNAVGVDSKTGQTEQVSGLITNREAVDACGSMVDGWLAHLDIRQTSGGTTVSRAEDDVFSTDMGGLLISQHIVESQTTANGSSKLDVTYSIGQTSPSQLPAGTP